MKVVIRGTITEDDKRVAGTAVVLRIYQTREQAVGDLTHEGPDVANGSTDTDDNGRYETYIGGNDIRAGQWIVGAAQLSRLHRSTPPVEIVEGQDTTVNIEIRVPVSCWKTFLPRVAGAVLLRRRTYEEIVADNKCGLTQALAVAFVGCSIFGWASPGAWKPDQHVPPAALRSFLAFLGWAVGVVLTWGAGTHIKWLRGSATNTSLPEYIRPVGFSTAPLLLAVVVPALVRSAESPAQVVFALVVVWQLSAAFVAIRQALDYSHQWLRPGILALLLTAALIGGWVFSNLAS